MYSVGGFYAVCTFFTLSGYLSYYSAINDKKFSVRKYYLKRFVKIYIPLAFTVFLTIIVSKLFSDIKWINLKPESLSALLGYNNYWQLNASLDYFTKHIVSPLMHFWFISILIQFDLIFPLLFCILKKLDKKINNNTSTIIVLLLTIFSIVYFFNSARDNNLMVTYYDTFTRCFSLLSGVLLAIIHNKYGHKYFKVFKTKTIIPFLLYLLVLIIISIYGSSNILYLAPMMLVTTFASLKIIEYSTIKSKENKLINYLSKLSYELYLLQYPVIFFVGSLISNDILKNVVAILITISFSVLMYALINNTSHNKFTKIICYLIISAVFIYGGLIFANEKDYSKEMKELEIALNENLKEIENQNEIYLSNLNEAKDRLNSLLQEMESGEAQIAEYVHNLPVVGIGDSVLLAASPGLKKVFPNGLFDGKVSRTIVEGREILSKLTIDGKVDDIIILALANNGDYIESRNTKLMEVVGDRQVFWINAVLADVPDFNDRFKEFAKDYPNIHIVDWENYSKNHPEYFYGDGIHVKGDGINAYAQLVYDAVYDYYLEEFKDKYKDRLNEHQNQIEENSKLLEDNSITVKEINANIENLSKRNN